MPFVGTHGISKKKLASHSIFVGSKRTFFPWLPFRSVMVTPSIWLERFCVIVTTTLPIRRVTREPHPLWLVWFTDVPTLVPHYMYALHITRLVFTIYSYQRVCISFSFHFLKYSCFFLGSTCWFDYSQHSNPTASFLSAHSTLFSLCKSVSSFQHVDTHFWNL